MENFLFFNEFLNESVTIPDNYLTEINEEKFRKLLDTYCKNFDPNDEPILRGDKELQNNFYFLNTKLRTVSNFENNTYDLFHLYFLDKWENLPRKSNSADFVIGDTGLPSHYGNVYRFIPFDDGKYMVAGIGMNKMVRTYNKVLYDDKIVGSVYQLNIKLKQIISHFNKSELEIKEKVEFLNELFKNESPIIKVYDLDRLLHTIKLKKLTFEEYLTHAFSPESYTIKEYNDLKYGEIGWSDTPGMMIKLKFSKNFFKKKKMRISISYTKTELDEIIVDVKHNGNNIGEYMKWLKTNHPKLDRNDMKYITKKLI